VSWLLVELTNKENTPWSEVYDPGKKGIEIDKQVIIDYYKRLPLDKLLKQISTG